MLQGTSGLISWAHSTFFGKDNITFQLNVCFCFLSVAQPIYLCPVDLHKLQQLCGFDAVDRYKKVITKIKFFSTYIQKQNHCYWVALRPWFSNSDTFMWQSYCFLIGEQESQTLRLIQQGFGDYDTTLSEKRHCVIFTEDCRENVQ